MFTASLTFLAASPAKSLGEKTADLYRAFRAYRKRRKTYRDLMEVEDHILKDIGLSRSDVMSVVYGSPNEWRARS